MDAPTSYQYPHVAVAPLKPEWVRLPAAVEYSGIGRSSLYQRIASGEIRSALIRKPGNVRGIRVVSVASLDAFVARMADATSQDLVTT